jgi:hypothetical protein
VVNAIDNQGNSTIRLQPQRAVESIPESVFVCREARPLIGHKPRVLRRETIEKTAKNCLGEDALLTLAVRIAQVAIVLGDEPVIFIKRVQELLARPRLAMSGRTKN